MGLEQQSRYLQFFGAFWQAVATFGTGGSEVSGEPMAFAAQHIVAVLPIALHVIAFYQVAKAENFRNIDVLRAGQALIAVRAKIRNGMGGVIHSGLYCRILFGKIILTIQHGKVLIEMLRCVHTQRQCGDLRVTQAEASVVLDGGQGISQYL